MSAGDYSTAASYYVKYLWENPDSPNSYVMWNNLGCCLLKLKEYDKAIISFDRALAINPQYKAAELNRAAAVQLLAGDNRTIEINQQS
jgi:tetratricopeptide (TPR) repeat protein